MKADLDTDPINRLRERRSDTHCLSLIPGRTDPLTLFHSTLTICTVKLVRTGGYRQKVQYRAIQYKKIPSVVWSSANIASPLNNVTMLSESLPWIDLRPLSMTLPTNTITNDHTRS